MSSLITHLSLAMICWCLSLDTGYGQNFEAPTDGKAVVYLTRMNSIGLLTKFNIFHNDRFIGRLGTTQFFRLECDPGEHLFWAKSENYAFTQATLEEGGIYVLDAVPAIGGLKAQVDLRPIAPENVDDEINRRLDNLLNNREPLSLSEAELEDLNGRYAKQIKTGLRKYERRLKARFGYLVMPASSRFN